MYTKWTTYFFCNRILGNILEFFTLFQKLSLFILHLEENTKFSTNWHEFRQEVRTELIRTQKSESEDLKSGPKISGLIKMRLHYTRKKFLLFSLVQHWKLYAQWNSNQCYLSMNKKCIIRIKFLSNFITKHSQRHSHEQSLHFRR